jgi:hypothetical protein
MAAFPGLLLQEFPSVRGVNPARGRAEQPMTVPEHLAAALADRYRIERPLGQGGMAAGSRLKAAARLLSPKRRQQRCSFRDTCRGATEGPGAALSSDRDPRTSLRTALASGLVPETH